MSENSVENEVVRRCPCWLVPLVAGVCVIALAGGVTGGVIAWRDDNARALADAQSRCECSLAKVDEARKAYAKMVESAGGMKAVKAEQVADASAARRSPPTCSPAGSPAGRAPPPWTPRGPVPRAPEQAVSWAASHGGADGPAHRSGHGARRIGLVYATGAGECGMPPPAGTAGDPYGSAMAENADGAYRTGLVRRRKPFRDPRDPESATFRRVSWRGLEASAPVLGLQDNGTDRNRVLCKPSGASRPTIRAEQKTGHIIQFRYCSDSRRSLRVLVQATEEPQRTSSLQKLMAHWMTDTLAFSQTVPMGRTATQALSLAKKPRRQHVKL